MKEDILITVRILSKEWQIRQCEKTIKDTSESISERLTIIDLLDDDMSVKGYGEHHHLQSLLKEIDIQEELMVGLKQDLQKLNTNADGQCQCPGHVANRMKNRGDRL